MMCVLPHLMMQVGIGELLGQGVHQGRPQVGRAGNQGVFNKGLLKKVWRNPEGLVQHPGKAKQ